MRKLPVSSPRAPAGTDADDTMRRSARQAAGFFAASLLLAVGVGGLLGSLLLATLTTGTNWLGSWGAPGVRRAHAYAQVFGFAAMYVMGVAFHVIPRLTGQVLRARVSLPAALLSGAVGSVAAIGLALADSSSLVAWRTAHLLLSLSALSFGWAIAQHLRGAELPGPMRAYLLAGWGWFVVAAAWPVLAPSGVRTLPAVWEAMLWGFAASWIYGMSLRILPAALGAPWQPAWADRWVWLAHQLGVASWVAAHAIAAGPWWSHAPTRLLAGTGAVALSLAATAYTLRVGLFAPNRRPVAHPLPGTEKFLFAAYAWLLVAVIEGLVWAAWHALRGTPSGGPSLDFARHAFTLGFLSQMIFGVSMRVIPTAAGLPLWSERWRDASFWLLNAAVALRLSEVAAFVQGLGWLYPWTAVSGLLAWAAFVAFAVNVIMTLRRGRQATPTP